MKNTIVSQISEYYSEKLNRHGETPQGVDWNGSEGQYLRFEKLMQLVNHPQYFSINDIGCGYGALYEYLQATYKTLEYRGVDVSADMIEAAKRRFANCQNASFFHLSIPDEMADYSVASGIFNVKFANKESDWHSYILSTLRQMNSYSAKGFAFNCLTSFSDKEKMRDDLYYADPCYMFQFCKENFSRNVALLHDYNLFEFTILVRKS
ncbi:SAM-dependent methyltransferase [Rheinheimera sp. KL1]|uniref:class I SAM-dependent methyltransferase n=1 Tax=Rheinheimera sp. KL1 TaxID=1635005 RepID=UPI0006A97E20|nr:class I SAM-dependent methyltransferase [Rheinheimera sp. KL1]KOO58152.1 SAM-dependent methyltransferase [Rheinheimera sp. KL1]